MHSFNEFLDEAKKSSKTMPVEYETMLLKLNGGKKNSMVFPKSSGLTFVLCSDSRTSICS
jgi:hypothetical protein